MANKSGKSKKLTRKSKNKNKTYRKRMNGGYGASNFSELPTKYYYSTNNYNNDPNNPTTMQSGRLTSLQQGGNRKQHSKKRNSKRQKGGNSILSFGIPSNNNFNNNFGTTNGALGQYNIMKGVQNMDRNTNSQNLTFTNKI
jgi:hypothetical protein